MTTRQTKASGYTRFCTRVLTVQGMVIVIALEVRVRLGEVDCTWRMTVTDCGGGGGGGGPEDDPPPQAAKNAKREIVEQQIALAHTGSIRPLARFVPKKTVRNRANTKLARICGFHRVRGGGTTRR